MVFYRKYRPQAIDELDSESVRNTLESIFKKEDSIPHAFLFTGSKGLGKTSTARIIAKVVNCTNRKKGSIEPCNKCDQCISITNGSNLDVLEIDGASNRGIDEIRDLREKIKLSPAGSYKKVYIIDEVHMLTTEAFNALLKTLEEPPAHALFVLCTTEPHKVPETILSRCFHISFQKATKEELIRSLSRIVKGEKLDVEKEALDYISSLSDGAFRDGAKILEEVSLLADCKKITKDLVEKKYQASGISHYVMEFLNLLQQKKTKENLEIISKLEEQGTDMKFFTDQLMQQLHVQLLENVGGKQTLFGIEEIKKIIQLLNEASLQTKYAVIPQLPLELVVVEWRGEADHLPQVHNSVVEQKV